MIVSQDPDRQLAAEDAAAAAERVFKRMLAGEDHYNTAITIMRYWAEWLAMFEPDLAAAFFRSLAERAKSDKATEDCPAYAAVMRDAEALLRALRANRNRHRQ